MYQIFSICLPPIRYCQSLATHVSHHTLPPAAMELKLESRCDLSPEVFVLLFMAYLALTTTGEEKQVSTTLNSDSLLAKSPVSTL